MSASDTLEDSASGGSIVTDEQSSSSSESRAPETQQVSGFGPGFSGSLSATESVLQPKEGATGIEQPPSADVQHEMMEISGTPSPPSEGISSMEVSQPSERQSLEQPAIPKVPIENPLEVAQPSPATQSRDEIGKGVLIVPQSGHSHYKTEKCDCLEITDEGGVVNPHKPLTRSVVKVTENLCYKIKIDLPEFSLGDISVSIVDGRKLSIYAKRDVNAAFGRECHEFQKILQIPEDANASSVAADFKYDGKLIVRLDKKTGKVSKKTK